MLQQTSLAGRIIAALDEAAGAAFDPEAPGDIVEIREGEAMEWIAQTYRDTEMINLFRIVDTGHQDSFIAVCTGDGGRISRTIGPAISEEDLKVRVGNAPEGWTEV